MSELRDKQLELLEKIYALEASSNGKDKNKSLLSPPIKLTRDSIRHSASFLHTSDLANLCGTSRYFRIQFTEEMQDKKKVREKLIGHVFNADPKSVMEFFSKPDAKKKMILTRVYYFEGYFSKKLQRFICFRKWGSVSPIQAAARCLDNFLLLKLLSIIENEPGLRLIAAQQLREVLRKARNEKLEAAIPPSGDTRLITKLSSDKQKVTAEKLKVEYEDWAAYGAPYEELSKASNEYTTKHPLLCLNFKWKELEQLFEKLSECHKKLPQFGKQEFFDTKPFNPTPKFDIEPKREECHYFDGTPLDLDDIGLGTEYAWYKHTWECPTKARVSPPCSSGPDIVAQDTAAIDHLYKVRLAELENIIVCLETPGAAITLVRLVKSERSEPSKPI